MVKLVDTWDLKSQGRQLPCEFESRPGHRLSDFINNGKTAKYAVSMPFHFLKWEAAWLWAPSVPCSVRAWLRCAWDWLSRGGVSPVRNIHNHNAIQARAFRLCRKYAVAGYYEKY